jgi:simple sugar transport system permease protein
LSLAVLGAFVLQTLKIGILRSGLPPEFNMLVMAVLVAAILVLQSPAGARLFQRRARSAGA